MACKKNEYVIYLSIHLETPTLEIVRRKKCYLYLDYIFG